ncbi:MAG TPA: hypothetical protein VED86_05360, partial [archaeon]|nr:hypothetical protein [archaeon]
MSSDLVDYERKPRWLTELTANERPTNTNKASPPIRGNTTRVYLFVLKNGPCELREVQRALKLSTPSLAFYHLSRLVQSGVV